MTQRDLDSLFNRLVAQTNPKNPQAREADAYAIERAGESIRRTQPARRAHEMATVGA